MELETTNWKCKNCDARRELDHDGHGGPICPECNVEEMTQMAVAQCMKCGGTDWTIHMPEPGSSMHSADSTAICQNCGATARVTEDGLWW